jgi:hypothetical protein
MTAKGSPVDRVRPLFRARPRATATAIRTYCCHGAALGDAHVNTFH